MVMVPCSTVQALAPTMTAKSPPRARRRRIERPGIGFRVAVDACARKRAWLVLCACCVAAAGAATARAQAAPADAGAPETAGAPPPPPPVSGRRPPEVIRLEPILIEDPALVSTDTLEVF